MAETSVGQGRCVAPGAGGQRGMGVVVASAVGNGTPGTGEARSDVALGAPSGVTVIGRGVGHGSGQQPVAAAVSRTSW